MKISLLLLAAASLCGSGAALANPHGLGPSAIEAARLKVHPPANYLAHYLPDDRYKIAGGVWKFVSTDLDTYYHVPSSPNMLRQPASRVIGFANVADAEEAGYIPDPTDGTANAAQVKVVITTDGAQSGSYVEQISALLLESKQQTHGLVDKLKALNTGQTNATPGSLPPAVRQMFDQYLRERRSYTTRVAALRPPPRYRKFHSLLLTAFRLGSSSNNAALKLLSTGDLRQIGQMQTQLMQAVSVQQAIVKEGTRVGINPDLLQP